jgi:hypothetical protein
MSANYARIAVRTHELILGRRYFTYEWEGKRHWPVYISHAYIANVEAELKNMPWPLVKVRDEPWLGSAEYIRGDVAGGWWARAIVARNLAAQVFAGIYARLIMTAMIWGFAYVSPAVSPSWRDLKWPWKKGKGQL